MAIKRQLKNSNAVQFINNFKLKYMSIKIISKDFNYEIFDFDNKKINYLNYSI